MAVDVAWWLFEQLRHDASEGTITKYIYIYIYIYVAASLSWTNKENLLQQFWINDCVIAIIVVIVDWVDGTKVGSPT